jgi:hypothetical protein
MTHRTDVLLLTATAAVFGACGDSSTAAAPADDSGTQPSDDAGAGESSPPYADSGRGESADARDGSAGASCAPGDAGPIGDPNSWTNVASPMFSYAEYGVLAMGALPCADLVLAGVGGDGIWGSHDAGSTWKRMGTPGQITNRPYRFLPDPADPASFWVSGNYGDCLFVTHDSGASFTKIGMLQHCDDVGVDFTDPQRKTVMLGMHEQSRMFQRTTDSGGTWANVGLNLPANSNFSSNAVVFDANHFLVATAGWAQNQSWGIYLTTDGGTAFKQVSTAGASGPALVAHDGAIYWNTLWSGTPVKSTDQGATWQSLPSCPITGNMAELPDGTIVGPGGNQLYASTDHGGSWSPLGPQIPIKPQAVVYSAKLRMLFAWVLGGDQATSAFRWPH